MVVAGMPHRGSLLHYIHAILHASQPISGIKIEFLDLCVCRISVRMHNLQRSPFFAILRRRSIYLADLNVRRLKMERKVEIVPICIADEIYKIMGIPFGFISM